MVQSGNYYGASDSPDKSMELAMATKMQLVLEQPMADVSTGLVNRDFEGDFFKIGDTVTIVKPNISSMVVELDEINASDGSGGKKSDQRLSLSEVTFDKDIMTIDRFAKYAFFISDITKAEGKWNYESGNLDLAAHKIRRAHNLETLNAILAKAGTGATNVPLVVGTNAATPEAITSGDQLYEEVIVPLYAQLYEAGAITADGQITYGSNAQEGKQTYGCIYVPTKVYTKLLVSKYIQNRSTVAADEAVKTGQVKTVMGLDIIVEPSLDTTADEHVTVSNAAANLLCVVAGTKNLVTRAGKVLPPDKFRSHERFGDEFHGLEIYTEKVVEPKAGAVAFITL